jgi:hypothetical protein
MAEFDEVIRGYSEEVEPKPEKDKTAAVIEAIAIAAVLAMLLAFVLLVTVAAASALIWFIVEAWRTILG